MRFHILALSLFCLLSGAGLPAQRIESESLTIEQGLSQGMIFAILQTRNGFLWVATKQGLNRFDGYNFKCYAHNPFDLYSLAENTVTALFEDSRGWLWVGTENKGLDLFDRRSGRFFHFPLHFNRNTKSASFEVVDIQEAGDGSMYVIQRENGLVHLDIPAAWARQLPAQADLNPLTKVTLFPMEQFRLPGDDDETSLAAIETTIAGKVFVYSDKRLYHVETAKGFVRPASPVPGNLREIWAAIPRSLVHFQNGVLQSDPAPRANVSLARPAADGGFWLAVNRQLWHVAPGQTPDFSKPDWEVDADISAIETDQNGNIWIGTQGYGLRKINPQKQLFHKGAGGMSIWGVWRDFRGRYYCKVVNKVFPYDPATGKVGQQPAFPNGPERILDLCLNPSGASWLLGRGEQEYGTAVLQQYNPETGQTATWPFPFDFDAGKVELVLNNLISNALKFTPEGGKVVINVGGVKHRINVGGVWNPADVKHHINVGGVWNPADVTYVEIQITDTGIGIPAEALHKIFDRFYQVENERVRTSGGTGIGLALSKELAERMGGGIRLESTPGQGSTFFFRLPVRNSKDTPLQESRDGDLEPAVFHRNSSALPTDPERPLALLIEDNAELRAFILKCISDQWQVAEASDGEEGLAKARMLLPDIVISDLMMPLKDGYAVCRELRDNELTAHIPVILLTARSTVEAKIKGLQTGADDYLTKPFNTDELLARMHNLMEQRRRLRLHHGGALTAESAPATDNGLTAHDREFLRRFTAIVEQTLADETIGVEELAQKMFISRVQLHRKLKAVTGRNVTDFVRDYRLERAMAMLRNREGMVYEVAARAGFGSEKYFSRAFKEKFGMPPSQVM